MLRRNQILVCLAAAALWACDEDGVDLGGDKEMGPNDLDMGGPPPGDGGEPAPDGPVNNQFPDRNVPAVDCAAYDYRGTVYNCVELDRCDPARDFTAQLACCECDPQFCNADPQCNPEPDAGPPPPPDPDDGVAPPPPPPPPRAESCMQCHNGAQRNDYSGPGLSNPHPFPGAENVTCTGCHGGNAEGVGRLGSHVPPPPTIGDRVYQQNNEAAFFNRRTLAGIDKLEPADYESADQPGRRHTNLDWLQFVNPGDLRVTEAGRGCGAAGCHFNKHGQWVPRSVIATSSGIFSSTRFSIGVDNRDPAKRGPERSGDSLADFAARAVTNPAFNQATAYVGEVGDLLEQDEFAAYNGPWRDNGIYDANALENHIINANQDPQKPNRVRSNSPLEHIIGETVSMVCGDCHLNSAGQNDRYADFRSSGCTACHMEYSYDGRSRSGDPNVPRNEPANPDAIAAGERAHVEAHQIRNVAKVLPNGAFVRGISDRACVGCHQGSNRTVLQFWGIRLDQNQDVVNELQYPANPVTFTTTENDQRLYDPAVQNATFNGRNFNQHLLTEDYDGDNRDDTPPDIHYERGMGCIDCHGSRDMHGGTEGDATSGRIQSRQDQQVVIRCESCHGGVSEYAPTAECTTYAGSPAQCVVDSEGNALRHLTLDAAGNYFLLSRVSGQRHYVPQTRDVVINSNKQNPLNGQQIYNPKGSYAMGRADGNPQTGVGPLQQDPNRVRQGFSHMDNVECSACHASWTNNCVGCHLKAIYDANPANYFFSNITGERILLNFDAQFVYQTPVPMYLSINSRGKVAQVQPMEKTWWRYQDFNGNESVPYAFSDRLGEGNNPNGGGRNAHPALGHNQMGAHSIRGTITNTNEGPRYCVACHLNDAQLNDFGDEYDAFRAALYNNDYANLDFDVLQQHIGQNTGNYLNSPIWVHMTAGLGSGLFLFDATGCPVNPLDPNADRQYCPDGAPADNFDANNVVYDTDRIVEITGVPNASGSHPRLNAFGGLQRNGASNGQMAGPLGAQTIQILADPNGGRVLDSWLDADAAPQGGAANFLQ